VAVDIAAETLAEAFIKRKRFRGSTDAELVGWINGIADRKLAGFYRKDAVEKRALSKLGIDSPSLTEEEHHRIVERAGVEQLRELLREELRSLPEPQQDALRLRIVEELGYPEVAAALGITEQAARARVARALKALRGAMKDRPLGEEACR
jgi:RNA polymerase sigma-70 factor (ECF subfamily)